MNVSEQSVAERSFRDINIAERQMRFQAEQAMQAYVRLLISLANQYAGKALEEERRSNPNGPETWLPERWEAFLTKHVFMKPGNGWGSAATADPPKEILSEPEEKLKQREETLQEATSRLRDLLTTTLSNLDRLQAPGSSPKTLPAPPPAQPLVPGEPLLDNLARYQAKSHPAPVLIVNPAQALPATLPERPPEPPQADRPVLTEIVIDERPRGHAGIIDELRNWQSPAIPKRFRQLAGVTAERWSMQSMALYLVAHHGITTRLEIDLLLGQGTTTDRRTAALRKAVETLPEMGFLTRENLEITLQDGMKSHLAMMDLTNQGRELCSIFGWQIVESDRSRALRLFRGQSDQLMGAFFLIAQARMRGYQAMICPPLDSPAAPDVLLERDSESRYVIVEFASPLSDRMKAAAELLGDPGFFTLSCRARAQFLAVLKTGQPAQAPLAHAALADFETLIHVNKITADTPLWSDIW